MTLNFDKLFGQGPLNIGVSAVSLYVPRLRVSLEEWCGWTGNSWDKVLSTVGRSFRVPAPDESVYTMAATACLRLILDNRLDPRDIGFLALGTESSGDNAAGAVIIKGMLDRALPKHGLPRISRHCEVPEFKHACLGGVYAQKAAARYLALDGRGRQAIVVSADIAEYERGSSGEPTQGAAAAAQLIEANPRLYTLELCHSGSASDYRGVDFRKPARRHLGTVRPGELTRLPDYPIFNGPYSTICYTDEAIRAVDRMIERLGTDARTLYRSVDGWFLHRPYHRMPINVMAALYVWGLSRNPEQLEELEAICREAGTDYEKMVLEAKSSPDLFTNADGGHVNEEAYPEAMKVVKHFRYTPKFRDVLSRKMRLGVEAMKEIGNVYTGSLPAWIAAGLEEALRRGEAIEGKCFFTLGYGSGDAAEAMLIRISEGWRDAAARIGFSRALEDAVDLNREQYNTLHDGLPGPSPSHARSRQFVVERVGEANGADFQDLGIEYYRYLP